MSIISSLLTGGALIGKICQTLSGAVGNAYTDEETGCMVAVSELNISGVKFFQSNAQQTDMKSYAFNSNAQSDVIVVFPNDESGNGLAYEIPGSQKVNITSDLSSNHSPDKEVLVGVISDDSIQMDAARRPLVKLSLNNMKIGGNPVTISDYEISCTTDGLKIKSGSRSLGAMTHLNITSNTGVSLNSQSTIDSSANSQEYSYNIYMGDFGLKTGDVLSGQLHVEMTDSDFTAHRNTYAEPLHEAEERCFRRMGIIK